MEHRVSVNELFFRDDLPLEFAEGVELTFYLRGTTTKATLYAAETGGTTVANPTFTTTVGSVNAWIEAGSYTVKSGNQAFAWEAGLPAKVVGQRTPLIYADELGCVGDGVFDNTEAVIAIIENASPGAVVQFGKGVYKIGSLGTCLAEKQSITLRGGGRGMGYFGESNPRSHTTFFYTGTGTFIELGTFSSTPASIYEGLSQGFSLENVVVRSTVGKGKSEGERGTICIKDNGCGDVTLHNVQIEMFGYGFAAPYGSDFTSFNRCAIHYSDVGAYFGPGSQQSSFYRAEFAGCGEGLVLDSAQHGYAHDCWFIDNHTVDVQFEYLATTRFGLVLTEGQRNGMNNYRFKMESCWHESDASGTNVIASNGHIRTFTDKTDKSYPRGIHIVNPIGVFGGTESSTRAFWECTTGKFLTLDSPLGEGNALRYWMNHGEALSLIQKNGRTIDGSTTIKNYRNESVDCIEFNEWEGVYRTLGTKSFQIWENGASGGHKFRWQWNEGVIKLNYWFVEGEGGQWLDRFNIDPQNATVSLRDAILARKAANVIGMGTGTHFSPPKYSAAEAKVETLYIDSTSGKLMFKNASSESKEL